MSPEANAATPGTLLRAALAMLLATVVGATAAYHYVVGWSVIDSFYMVVITLSTVGFREVYPLTETGKLITIAVIGIGLGALTLVAAGVTRLMLEGEIGRAVGRRKMDREMGKLRGHYIVCGYGRVGRVVCRGLARERVPFVVVDPDEAAGERIDADGYLLCRGEATAEKTLLGAGIERAKGIILALPSEADNVYVTLLSRDLCPGIFVIARGISDQGERGLLAAGADRVVSPNILGGDRMVHSALRPAVVEFVDIVAGNKELAELQLQEVTVGADSALAGKTIEESEARRRFGLMIIGRLASDGSLTFNPSPEDMIDAGSTLIVMGPREDLDRFANEAATR